MDEVDSRLINFFKTKCRSGHRIDIVREHELLFAKMYWEDSNNLKDIQALNLMFIRGLLPKTPYHFGPLDEETNLIIDKIYNINLFGFFSIGSQPYDKFDGALDEDIGKKVTQRPFLEGFYSREKSTKLMNELKNIENIIIIQTNVNTKKKYLMV